MTAFVALVLLAGSAVAAEQPPAAPSPQVIKLELYPAKSPRRALAYPLLPTLREQTPGNAAVYYHRAMSQIAQAGDPKSRADHWRKIGEWQSPEKPLADLPLADAAEILKAYRPALREVEAAARCRDCDWGLERRIDADGVAVMLTEVQGTRELVNLLSLKARVETAEGRVDDALQTVRTGITLSRHVGEGPTLIQALVGMALAAIMEARLEELVRRPDCPSLYWSLAGLPRPFLDMRVPFQGEMLMIDRTLPDLRDLEKGPMTPEQANKAMDDLVRRLAPLNDMNPDDVRTKLMVTGWVALGYPAGKKALIADGMKAEDVEKLPAAQVVLLDSWGRFLRMRDDVFKWASLPYPEGRAGMQAAFKAFRDADKSHSPILTVLAVLMPAVEKVAFAAARTERRFAGLRAVEALRLYAGSHDGKLPASLADVKEVPVPADPLTGKPFEYESKDGAATLTAPPPAGEEANPGNSFRYEITMKRPG